VLEILHLSRTRNLYVAVPGDSVGGRDRESPNTALTPSSARQSPCFLRDPACFHRIAVLHPFQSSLVQARIDRIPRVQNQARSNSLEPTFRTGTGRIVCCSARDCGTEIPVEFDRR